MKKQIKRTFSLGLVLLLMFALLIPLSVGATGEKPLYLNWDGPVATWKAPASDVLTYEVGVQMGGNLLTTVNTPNTSYDFTDLMKNCGPGYYNFAVNAVYEGGVYSETAYSSPYLYEESTAHPHPLKYHEYKAPTCTENGNREYYECPVCDQYFIDSKGQELYETKGDVVLSATGHKWGDWKITKEPTATTEGEAIRYCEHDPDHRETKVLAKLGTPTEAATQPSTAPATVPSTVPSSQPVTQPSTQIVVGPVNPTEGNDGLFGGAISLPVLLLIIAGVLIVAAAIIVPIIVVSSKKKKEREAEMANQNQYPQDPMYNPNNPNNQANRPYRQDYQNYPPENQQYQDINNYQDNRNRPDNRNYHDDFDNQN